MFDPMEWPEWGSTPPAGTDQYMENGHAGPIIATGIAANGNFPDYGPYLLMQCRTCILNHIVGPLPPEADRTHNWRQTLQGYIASCQGLPEVYCYLLDEAPDPQELLLQLYEVMRPGDTLHIHTMNACNPVDMALQRATGLPLWWVDPPYTLSYFTPKTLQLMVRRCGFTVEDQYAYYRDQFDSTRLTAQQRDQLKRQQMAECRLGDFLYARAKKVLIQATYR